ncbi:MAG: hypothetical protein HP028_02905 [Clostridia bacterium]|nr:hypothetical protein [Clostridia bacterium]
MRNRYFIYKQNKKLAGAGIIAIMLVILMLAIQWQMPLKKAVVEGNGWEMALPIFHSYRQSQNKCPPELNMPCTLTLKMFSKEEVKVSILTEFCGWREMETFPTEHENERALLGLEAWAMHEYYLKIEQGSYKAYLHFKVVKSINDS